MAVKVDDLDATGDTPDVGQVIFLHNVPEVWIWRRGAFEIYALAALVERKDETQAVREFRDALRAGS